MRGYARTILLGPDLWVGLIAGVAGATLLDDQAVHAASGLVGSAQAQIGTALLGVVVAGLAIFVVFMQPEYVAVLEKLKPGFEADLFPFVWTALIAGLCALAGVLLMLFGSIDPAPVPWLRVVFGGALWMFVYLIFAMFDLVLALAGHARNRILQMKGHSKRD